MATKSTPLLFFGNERLSSGFTPQGAPTLEALIAHGYDIKAVVANYERAKSRNARELEIAQVAEKHNIPVLLPRKPVDIIDQLAEFHAEAAILVAYGKIIPQAIIDIFPYGIINIHPSLLPKYRGPTPIEQAILDNAPATGVSVMKLVKEMDAGPVYAQHSVSLTGQETKQALTERLLHTGGELLIKHLPHIFDGSLQPTPQDEQAATFSSLISKDNAVIDWREPAELITRKLRAYAGWPQVRGKLDIAQQSFDTVITNGEVADIRLPAGQALVRDGKLLVGTSSTAFEILALKIPGKKEISAGDFIRGYVR